MVGKKANCGTQFEVHLPLTTETYLETVPCCKLLSRAFAIGKIGAGNIRHTGLKNLEEKARYKSKK